MKREMQRRTSAFHGQRSKIACFSCFFYDSLRQSSGLFRESLVEQRKGKYMDRIIYIAMTEVITGVIAASGNGSQHGHGTVSGIPRSGTQNAINVFGRTKLVNPPEHALERGGDVC
ncbi:hypothetical protein AB6Q56_22975 (plasmid) [Dechloromonas sp. ARDL1]|uniref:hypothetical protein n=1 Tax=Dechloromonas sp. ARDL1 TaxID=3322121 RepID=UPI003DA768B7